MLDIGYSTPAISAMSQYGLNQSNGFNFNNLLKNLDLGFVTKGFDYMDKYSKPLGAVGGIWSAYNQQNMSNNMYDLSKQAFDYNKYLSNLELKRRDDADKNLLAAYQNSTYNKG